MSIWYQNYIPLTLCAHWNAPVGPGLLRDRMMPPYPLDNYSATEGITAAANAGGKIQKQNVFSIFWQRYICTSNGGCCVQKSDNRNEFTLNRVVFFNWIVNVLSFCYQPNNLNPHTSIYGPYTALTMVEYHPSSNINV